MEFINDTFDTNCEDLSMENLTTSLVADFFDSVKSLFGNDCGLSDDMIVDSVAKASDFFNIENPSIIQEGWTTGVCANNPFTTIDDSLMFNREQLLTMGITEKDGLDLVMTHECAHRALQDQFNLNLSSHQEELCCDFMAGVRAGLNGIDVSQMESSLADTIASDTHPAGELRVEAIEAGVAFAEDYMDKYGVAPTFEECIEYITGKDSCITALVDVENGQIILREVPEGEVTADDEMKGFVNDKEWQLKEARKAAERGDLSKAKDRLKSADMCSK